jgi:3' terminal RNA ribose 2'-O-methyltransferase Hen1
MLDVPEARTAKNLHLDILVGSAQRAALSTGCSQLLSDLGRRTSRCRWVCDAIACADAPHSIIGGTGMIGRAATPPRFNSPILETQPTMRPAGPDTDHRTRKGYGPNKVAAEQVPEPGLLALDDQCRLSGRGVNGFAGAGLFGETVAVLVTITSTAAEAADLGFLLHKHPGRVQSFEVAAGRAHVFYPEATPHRCTVALLLELDPVALVRGRGTGGPGAFALSQYVNDRPYAASSMLAVALGRVFRTAMAGRCDDRPDLPGRRLPLEVHIPSLPCEGGVEVARRVFAPLGWSVAATSQPLDPQLPHWGQSRYLDVRLTGDLRLAESLNHLYVLLPVLDDTKHYWVTTDEIDKLVRAGQGWLHTHPDRDLILRRYLAHQRTLVSTAVGRLAEVDDAEADTLDNTVPHADTNQVPEQVLALAGQRRAAVVAALRTAGAARVVDLGCGEGALLRALLGDPSFTEVVGVDVSARALEVASRRLDLERMPPRQRERVRLVQSSLTYRDARLAGFDAVVLMEVIEHVDPPRLGALQRTVFAHARPATVVVTTPNVEHNVRFPDLPAGAMRHHDHRFEWTRAQFRAWARSVATDHGYAVRHLPVGPDDPQVGPPTQMAVFTRHDHAGDPR